MARRPPGDKVYNRRRALKGSFKMAKTAKVARVPPPSSPSPPSSALQASIRSFVAVAERRGFSAAARVLSVSPSALSQAVRLLEERVGVPLLVRTTRSVNLTEAGRRLYERVAPALRETEAALDEARGSADVVQGTLRITAGRVAVPLVIDPVLAPLLAAHPRLSVEVDVDDRFVDIVARGFDAGVRLHEAIDPDLTAVRLTPPFRFVVAGSPAYLNRHGRPQRPRDLLAHECIGWRLSSTGGLYEWEFERRGREERVAVRGRVMTNESGLMVRAARAGLGLVYLIEQELAPYLDRGELELVLEDHAVRVPGFFFYFPHRAQHQPKIRAFLQTARGLGLHLQSPPEPAKRR
jgi:DNA-binding transcriptional LysR family regulator